jgi:hypothetical protein
MNQYVLKFDSNFYIFKYAASLQSDYLAFALLLLFIQTSDKPLIIKYYGLLNEKAALNIATNFLGSSRRIID